MECQAVSAREAVRFTTSILPSEESVPFRAGGQNLQHGFQETVDSIHKRGSFRIPLKRCYFVNDGNEFW